MLSFFEPKLDRPRDARSSAYVATLDGWRAVAVFLVIGVHCSAMLRNNGSFLALNVDRVLSHAGIGVDIFFSLSGFLITRLLLVERGQNGSARLGAFYVRRAFRILPPVLVYIIVLVLLRTANLLPDVTNDELAASILFYRNYLDGSWYTGHFWSLSVEEHFYILMPVMLVYFRPSTMMKLTIFVAAIFICVRFYELAQPSRFGMLPQFRTENRVDALLWGSLLAQVDSQAWGRPLLTKWLKLSFIIATAFLAAVILLLFESQALRRTIVAMVLPFPIMWTIIHYKSRVSLVLEIPVIRYVGRLSFSLYIWQMLFLVPFGRPLGVAQSFPLALILPLAIAIVSYRFIEKPFIRLGHAISGSTRLQSTPHLEQSSKLS